MADEDGWQGPRRNDEGDFGRLLNLLREHDQRLTAVERGAPLKAAGIRVTEDGMTVESALDVAGDLNVSGNAAITGTLSLPAGIIDNEALATPLTQASGYGNSTNFPVGTVESASTLALFTVPVPAGFTAASFIVEGAAGVRNLGASNSFAYLRAYFQHPDSSYEWGSRQNVDIEPGTTKTLSALLVRSVTGLTGGQNLTFFVAVFADDAQAAHTSNFASAAALVTFTR